MRRAELTRANFADADLSLANLEKASGTRSVFHGANLAGARLFAADLSRADFTDAISPAPTSSTPS